MPGYVPPVSFGALLGLLSVATIVGVGVAVVTHQTLVIPVVIGAAIAVGIAYIVLTYGSETSEPDVSDSAGPTGAGETVRDGTTDSTLRATSAVEPTRPVSAPSAGAAPAREQGPVDPADEEPFYDPVEEADRLESSGAPDPPPPSGSQHPK
ncbi:MAG: hypothetical protein WCB18_08425 [Thermoplasmata archaeon]